MIFSYIFYRRCFHTSSQHSFNFSISVLLYLHLRIRNIPPLIVPLSFVPPCMQRTVQAMRPIHLLTYSCCHTLYRTFFPLFSTHSICFHFKASGMARESLRSNSFDVLFVRTFLRVCPSLVHTVLYSIIMPLYCTVLYSLYVCVSVFMILPRIDC